MRSLLVFLMLAGSAFCSEQSDKEYQTALDKAKAEYDAKVKVAKDKYVKDLKVEMDVATKKGAPGLDEALALREKIAGLEPVQPKKAENKSDLLRTIDLNRDQVSGTFKFENNAIVTPNTKDARIQIPVAVTVPYTVEFDLERLDGNNALWLGVPVNHKQIFIMLDGWQGTVCGIEMLDGKRAADNETKKSGRLLNVGEKHRISVSVTDHSVGISDNETVVVSWDGDLKRIKEFTEMKVPNHDAMVIGTFENSLKITGITLKDDK